MEKRVFLIMTRRYRNKTEAVITRVFLFIEIILYFSFLYLDFFYQTVNSAVLKFTGILLCWVYALLLWIMELREYKKNGKDRLLLLAALSFTVLADICLLLLGYYFYGVCFFILVQMLYLMRFSTGRGYIKSALIRRIILGMFFTAVLFLMMKAEKGLSLAIGFYFAGFIDNLILLTRKPSCNFHYPYFLIGMLLFFVCDINVGFYNLGSYVQIQNVILKSVVKFSEIGMWFFYLPGQVMISLSGARLKVR